jgi:hypothetical protein
LDINPKNAFIDVGLFLENRQEARKLGLLPYGKSFAAGLPSDRSRRSGGSVFSRDNPTSINSNAFFGCIDFSAVGKDSRGRGDPGNP